MHFSVPDVEILENIELVDYPSHYCYDDQIICNYINPTSIANDTYHAPLALELEFNPHFCHTLRITFP